MTLSESGVRPVSKRPWPFSHPTDSVDCGMDFSDTRRCSVCSSRVRQLYSKRGNRMVDRLLWTPRMDDE